MSLIDIKSATITDRGQISIPKEIRKIHDFKKGSKVAILAYGDRIEILPIKEISKRMSTAFATEFVLSKDWNSEEENETWKNL